ncbi:MAG TPA: lipid-A-disaccharide synthase [Paludibacteraceae bacterium]|nr:lipid-A-disaccharide synthase [Paludibacteraceae bacterium]HPT44067.1 lipid-A-disaccharide synthase [Paludibacteraceae bacterium]
MKYFLIAGEASGDLHASNLMRELKEIDAEAEFCFLGGDLMAAQGGMLVNHYRDMAFMGFLAVVQNAGKIARNMDDCKTALAEFHPDVLILIDYPSFNLRIARYAKEKLNIPVYYYISPKIWAWKEFRIKLIKKYVDRMFTILPFETEFYNRHNYAVTYVGNPSVDSIAARPNQEQTLNEFCSKNRLPEKPIIALLAGSRRQEIKSCLPVMLEAASRFPGYQTVISGAPGIEPEFYTQLISQTGVNLVFNQTYELLQHAQVAVVNSGTATLETALIGTPQVVVYKVAFGRLAMMIKPLVIKTKFVSLVNLIAGKEVVRELLAHHFTPETVYNELHRLLNEPAYRSQQQKGYQEISRKLGAPGAARKAAEEMYRSLKHL